MEHGLFELLTYMQLAAEERVESVVDADTIKIIVWQAADACGAAISKVARMPRVIFVR